VAVSANEARAFFAKAAENFAAAETELAAGRLNACANRAYYACFQAAVAALLAESIRPSGSTRQWSHEFVQAQFAGVLIARRKRYPAELRATLLRNQQVRNQADYEPEPVSEAQVQRALQRARLLVRAVEDRLR
jgi:uncharacterized protein (UPF0332 family)